MNCYSLTLGARNRRLNPPLLCLRRPGWFDPARRRFVNEQSRQVLGCTRELRRLKPWCRALADALHQKELLVIERGPARVFRYRTHHRQAVR